MSFSHPDTVETDVLVIGGGCGGCWAAIGAAESNCKVMLVEKGVVARSGGAVFCHDLLAPTPEGEFEAWLAEVVEQAENLCDQRYASSLLLEGGQRIEQMRGFGVSFETDYKGKLALSLGRGHKVSKVVLYNGRELMEVMKEEVRRRGVDLVERVMIIDLLTSDGQLPTQGRVVGAVGLGTRSGRFLVFKAKTVIVATGPISAKLHVGYLDNTSGDGQAAAYRAGAEMAGMEFIFTPSFACTPPGRAPSSMSLIPFQTQGAHIINRLGERFMDKYAGRRRERGASFGLLAQGMAKEIMEGRGPIYFDMRHFLAEDFQRLERILPARMAFLRDAGIDPAKELIECRPLVRHFGTGLSGGVRIGLNGESSVPGLFAAGICAQFPGCAEFLSGGMIAFCNVFGYRAGKAAAEDAGQTAGGQMDYGQLEGLKQRVFSPLGRKTGLTPMAIYHRLASKFLRPEFGIVKTETSIRDMLQEIAEAEQEDLPWVIAKDIHQLVKANEARNFVHLLRPIYLSALERKESRLAHYRRDYPYRDDVNWLKWVVARRGACGVEIKHVPLAEESFTIKIASPEKVPAPVQFPRDDDHISAG